MGSHIPSTTEDLRKRILWLEYRVTKLEKDLEHVLDGMLDSRNDA